MEMPLKRILLTISYDGTNYAGWQRQANAPSIQQEIETALAKTLGNPTVLYGASRTDAGVHALGQAAHFNTKCSIPSEKFTFILNNLLPRDIRITKSEEILPTAHARYSACGKMYTYRIYNHRHAPGIFHQYYAHVPVAIDIDKLKAALPALQGTHDFLAFCSTGSSIRTSTRTIYYIKASQKGHEVILTFCGNAFLYNMVRIIAGTLIEIGQGHLPKKNITKALETKNRLLLGPTAPAKGLELTAVYYPWHQNLPFTPIAKELAIHTLEGVDIYR